MSPNPQSGVQRPVIPRLFSARLTFQVGLLFLLSTVLSAGCVSKEQYKAEKVRGLNYQRLLAQEENRITTLNAQLEQKDKEINTLNAQLKETSEKIASLKSQNHDLTVELSVLKEQSRRQVEQEPVPDSPVLSAAPTFSRDMSLSEAPLAEPSLPEPPLSEPPLSEPSLSEPSLSEPSLSEPSLSDPFMSEEELMNILGVQPK